MPEELIDNKGEGAGDGAVVPVDGETEGDTAAAANATDNSGGDGEETVTIKKSEFTKLNSDLENYKKGLIGKKAGERDLHAKDAGDGEDEADDNKVVVDEAKVNETAIAAAEKTMRLAAEKTAKRSFLASHPEYLDDAEWQGLVAHLTFKGGELTSDEVLDRMEAALFEHKRATGKLDEHLKAEHERGVREGRVQASVESGHGTGGAGDRNQGGSGSRLSPEGERMAKAMHVDPEKAGKVDPSKDNEITEI